MGMGDLGALNTLLSYTMVGVGADLALWLLRNPENVVIGALTGVLANLAKLSVKWALGTLTGAPVGFVAFGMARAIISHVLFGALGGALGALTLIALRRAGFFAYLSEKK
jgi:hypothetical protein